MRRGTGRGVRRRNLAPYAPSRHGPAARFSRIAAPRRALAARICGAALLHAVSCAPDRNAISIVEGAACTAGARGGSGLQHIIDEITFYGQRRVTSSGKERNALMLKFPLLCSKLEKPAAILLFGALLSLGMPALQAFAGEEGSDKRRRLSDPHQQRKSQAAERRGGEAAPWPTRASRHQARRPKREAAAAEQSPRPSRGGGKRPASAPAPAKAEAKPADAKPASARRSRPSPRKQARRQAQRPHSQAR